jgi:hypothetical protein
MMVAFTLLARSQPVTLPYTIGKGDTTKYYYLGTCEEYRSMLHSGYWDHAEPCAVDFSRYDLMGVRENDTVRWTLVQPKKYVELTYTTPDLFKKVDWNVFPRDTVINDSATYARVRRSTKTVLPDTFHFDRTALVCNNVWVDCRGTFYYKILYDKNTDTIVCLLVKNYGGSRGMCPRYDWIAVDKPNPQTKIVMQEIWVN